MKKGYEVRQNVEKIVNEANGPVVCIELGKFEIKPSEKWPNSAKQSSYCESRVMD